MSGAISNKLAQLEEVQALTLANPEEHYYKFKNIKEMSKEERKFSIQVISKSPVYSYLLVSCYSLSITDAERHILFDSVLNDPLQASQWFSYIGSSDKEKRLLTEAMTKNPKIVAKILVDYPEIKKEFKDIMLDCIYQNPMYGSAVYARAKLTDEEYDKLVKAMASNNSVLLTILADYCMLGEFARPFNENQLMFMIDKAIEFNNIEAAHILNGFELLDEQKDKLVPLLVARRLMQK